MPEWDTGRLRAAGHEARGGDDPHGGTASRADALPLASDLAAKAARRIERLEREATQIRAWLAARPDDRRGAKGAIRKSNRTDSDSAKMATGKGVIQGYTGVAAVDGRHKIIVEAQARGTGAEQELLVPVVPVVQAMEVDALIADNRMRRRDERCATKVRHQQAPEAINDESRPTTQATVSRPHDVTYDAAARSCV